MQKTWWNRLLHGAKQQKYEQELSARFLRGILILGIILTIMGSISLFISGALTSRAFTSNLALLGFFIINWFVYKKGHTYLASLLIIFGFALYVGSSLYYFGGLSNPITGMYIVIALIAGMLLGQSGIVLSTVIAIASTLIIFTIEKQGTLPELGAGTVEGHLITFVSILFSCAVILYLWYGSLREAIEIANRELEERHRVEDVLRANEERYRMTSEVISDYSFTVRMVDDVPQLESVAGAFEQICGYTMQEFIATGGWAVHLHPDDLAQDAQDMEKLRQNQRVDGEIRIIHKDGNIRWVHSYAQPVWDAQNQRLVGIYGAVQNITARKLAEEREERRKTLLRTVLELGKTITRINDLQACLKAIHQGVQQELGFDRVGLFLYDPVSETVHGTYGTSRTGEIEDTSWFVQAVADYDPWQSALKTPKGITLEENFQNTHQVSETNEMFGVQQHVTLAMWAGDQPVGLIAADNLINKGPITPEHMEALQFFAGYAGLAVVNARMNSQLEERVQQRTAELEAAVNELEAFSYTISHDLRAPLRGIHGYVSILLEEFGASIPHQAHQYLSRVRNNAHHMGELVDDLLAFLHLSRINIQQRNINLNALVDKIFQTLTTLEPSSRKIEFINLPVPDCQCDPELIKQALTDLFSNAIKFTRQREQACIEFGALNKNGRTVYYIKDNGIGFDMRYSAKLFGVFQRLHTPGTDNAFEGTGVGLAIVQRIIHRHNGEIWAESEVDRGATFYFSL